LAASFGCFWKKDFLREIAEGDVELLRPNGLILSYPVITTGEFAHRSSFDMLLGERFEEFREEVSLEKQVSEDTPKTFLWHTYEDDTVPMENSLLFVQALRQKKIPVEFHLYPKGGHGLSIGSELTTSPTREQIQPEVTTWIDMAGTFIKTL
jgi:acetyl esterase/lipase